MTSRLQLTVCGWTLAFVVIFPQKSDAWNLAGHMLSGMIAYQILQRESPATIPAVRSILEKNPWYESRWKAQLDKLPESDRDEMLFMLATRWADDVRTKDRPQSHPLWHHISLPFKPVGEPDWVRTEPPQSENIVSAMTKNEGIALNGTDPETRAIALTWLFHLSGDIHEPLHTISLFTTEYPNGDRGGNRMCVRAAVDRPALKFHKVWDRVVTTSRNAHPLRNLAIELREKFPRKTLTELASTQPDEWAKESFEIAKSVAYQNGKFQGTPRGERKDCHEVTDAAVLPNGYLGTARVIADRRIMLAGNRLAALLKSLLKH